MSDKSDEKAADVVQEEENDKTKKEPAEKVRSGEESKEEEVPKAVKNLRKEDAVKFERRSR